MKYTVYISHTNNLKNKLHQAFYDFLKSIERKMFSKRSDLIQLIKKEINALNEQHRRCKPIKLYDTEGMNYKDVFLHSGTGISASILTLKSE